MTSQFADMTSRKIFWRHSIPLVKFSYWSKFHVNIIQVLELWQFSFIRDWPEIGNTTVWVLPNIWPMGRVRDTKFGTNVSNKMLLNAAKCQGYRFYHFWVIKGKPTGVKIIPPPPHLDKVKILSKIILRNHKAWLQI